MASHSSCHIIRYFKAPTLRSLALVQAFDFTVEETFTKGHITRHTNRKWSPEMNWVSSFTCSFCETGLGVAHYTMESL